MGPRLAVDTAVETRMNLTMLNSFEQTFREEESDPKMATWALTMMNDGVFHIIFHFAPTQAHSQRSTKTQFLLYFNDNPSVCVCVYFGARGCIVSSGFSGGL